MPKELFCCAVSLFRPFRFPCFRNEDVRGAVRGLCHVSRTANNQLLVPTFSVREFVSVWADVFESFRGAETSSGSLQVAHADVRRQLLSFALGSRRQFAPVRLNRRCNKQRTVNHPKAWLALNERENRVRCIMHYAASSSSSRGQSGANGVSKRARNHLGSPECGTARHGAALQEGD